MGHMAEQFSWEGGYMEDEDNQIDICNICSGKVNLMHPSRIYGKGYKHHNDPKDAPGKAVGWIYQCEVCKATVGCHNDTKKPYGTLADKKTKEARHHVHDLLDPLWENQGDGDYRTGSRGKKRRALYRLLSEHMNIPLDDTHMGMFDIDQCRIAYKFFLEYKKNMKKHD